VEQWGDFTGNSRGWVDHAVGLDLRERESEFFVCLATTSSHRSRWKPQAAVDRLGMVTSSPATMF
jgi:hypothetical protein